MSESGRMQPLDPIESIGALVAPEQQDGLQSDLMELLVWLTRRFTGGDSSSIPVEQAQELLRHIWFCIGQCWTTPEEAGQLLTQEPLRALYGRGEQQVRRKVSLARALLQKVQQTQLSIDNLSYQDTLRQLPEFFRRYDSYFAAHEIPCDIDYQLFCPVWERQGVDFMLEYLRALAAENEFCRRLDAVDHLRLLNAFYPDTRELLINLYEPVLVNALGRSLLKKDPRTLFFTTADQRELQQILAPLEEEALQTHLLQAVKWMLNTLGLERSSHRQYHEDSSRRLIGRIAFAVQAGSLDSLFPSESISKKNLPIQTEVFKDAPSMPDEALRAAIEELQNCASKEAKMKILTEQLRSIADLREVLPFFEPGELPAVFALMKGPERAFLRQWALQQDPPPDWIELLF